MLDELDVFQSRVRERAFQMWQAAGCPENTADEFWHRAREAEMNELNLSAQDLHRVEKKASRASDPEDFA